VAGARWSLGTGPEADLCERPAHGSPNSVGPAETEAIGGRRPSDRQRQRPAPPLTGGRARRRPAGPGSRATRQRSAAQSDVMQGVPRAAPPGARSDAGLHHQLPFEKSNWRWVRRQNDFGSWARILAMATRCCSPDRVSVPARRDQGAPHDPDSGGDVTICRGEAVCQRGPAGESVQMPQRPARTFSTTRRRRTRLNC